MDHKPQELGTVFARSMASTTKTERIRAVRRFEWLHEIVHVLSNYVEFPKVLLPDLGLPQDPRMISFEMIESAAMELREEWGLGNHPIPNLTWSMENSGIIVAHHDLWAESIDAFCEWSDSKERPFVILNTVRSSACRFRFNCAHEIAHLVLHKNVPQAALSNKEDFKRIEEQAHYFAGAFLLPEDSFADSYCTPTLAGFLALKPKWRVAISAMIKRARNLKLITTDQQRTLYMNMSRRRWRQREPLDDELEIEQPKMLRKTVDKLIGMGIIGPNDLQFRVGLNTADVEQVLGLPPDYLAPKDEPGPNSVKEPEPNILRFPGRNVGA